MSETALTTTEIDAPAEPKPAEPDKPYLGTDSPFEGLYQWMLAEIARLDGRISALDGPPPADELSTTHRRKGKHEES